MRQIPIKYNTVSFHHEGQSNTVTGHHRDCGISIPAESQHLTGQWFQQPYLVGIALRRELELTTSRIFVQTKLFHDCVRTQLVQPSKSEPEFVPCLGEL